MEKSINHTKWFILNVSYVLMFFESCAVVCVCFCTGMFAMVPLNLICQLCLLYLFFEISSIYFNGYRDETNIGLYFLYMYLVKVFINAPLLVLFFSKYMYSYQTRQITQNPY